MQLVTRFAFVGLALLLLAPSAQAKPAPLDEAAWTAVFGTAADGPTPTFLKELAKGMSPADAGKVFKGAEKPSKHGFAKITVKGVPGVTKMEIYFRKDKETNVPTQLGAVTLTLDKSVQKDPAVYAALVKVLTAKYGAVKKPESVEKMQITWTTKKLQSAQIWKVGRDVTFKYSF